MAGVNDIAVLIPAYQPDTKLVGLVDALRADFPHVVVVDDGSTGCDDVFGAIRNSVEALLVHPENRGKGAALKTGFAWIRERLPNVAGVVTADADGQHTPEDIRRVAEATAARNGGIVLGVRTFKGSVPLRSRFGNWWASLFFRLRTGLAIRDTQTGLRGIPSDMLDRMLALRGDRYEYETRMLVDASCHASPPLQISIETIYLESNRSSHFRPFRDSLRTQMTLWFCSLEKTDGK